MDVCEAAYASFHACLYITKNNGSGPMTDNMDPVLLFCQFDWLWKIYIIVVAWSVLGLAMFYGCLQHDGPPFVTLLAIMASLLLHS